MNISSFKVSAMDILLHDHLDGSFPLLTILPELFRLTYGANKKYPFDPWSDHHGQIKKWFSDVHRDIVEKFSITTGVLQDIDTLYIAGKTYTEVRARQGFKYCEARIAPQYLTGLGLNEKEAMDALVRGIKSGERNYPGIEVNLIFCIGREVSSERSSYLVKMAERCDREYVLAIDLACDEAVHPPEKHIRAFSIAKLMGFKTTCHASEWVKNRWREDKITAEQLKNNFQEDMPLLIKNIRTAIRELKVNRVGHATALSYDGQLMKYAADFGIGIEGNPASNLLTGVIPDIKSLKIREMLGGNILYSINPDDDLFMPDLKETIQICDDVYKFTEEEKLKLRVNAWKTRFGRRKPVPADIAHLI